MSQISVSLPTDGTTADVSDYNTPIATIVDDYNDNIDNSNIASNAAISTSKLATDAGITTGMLQDGAVTPAKRSGGFKVGSFTPSAGTGNKSVTGVGFQPKGVIFFGMRTGVTTEGIFSGGAYDGSNQIIAAAGARTTATTGAFTTANTAACVRVSNFSSGSENLLMVASGVSLDADGFTLNFTTNGTPQLIGYIAFG